MNPWVISGIIAVLVLLRSKAKAAIIPAPVLSIVKDSKISSPYLKYRGLRKDGTKIHHQGVDIKAPKGSPVRAVASGTIDKIWLDGQVYGYGNLLLIANKDGTGALYAHLDSFGNIYEGMPINKGEIIAYVGQTQSPRPEMKTAPHLHLEILKYHTRNISPRTPPRLDPLTYIKKQGMSVG